MRFVLTAAFVLATFFVASEAAPNNQCGVYDSALQKVAQFYKNHSADREKDDCYWCVAEIAGTVAGCVAGGWTGVGLIGCVAAAIGTVHDCYDCICYVVEAMGYSC